MGEPGPLAGSYRARSARYKRGCAALSPRAAAYGLEDGKVPPPFLPYCTHLLPIIDVAQPGYRWQSVFTILYGKALSEKEIFTDKYGYKYGVCGRVAHHFSPEDMVMQAKPRVADLAPVSILGFAARPRRISSARSKRAEVRCHSAAIRSRTF